MNYKILAIDDDPVILRLIKNALSINQYDVVTREVIDDINLCDFIEFDLILLDIMMPVNGIDICEVIRKEINVPIIFITAKDLEEDLIKGIYAGADDYITKPFSIKELLARVEMHLRREERCKGKPQKIIFGKTEIDLNNQTVMVNGEKLPLTKREFFIIQLLITNTKKTFTIEEIYDRVYPNSSNTQFRSISEYIYQIRNKFKPYGINPIETMWGGGYKWKSEASVN